MVNLEEDEERNTNTTNERENQNDGSSRTHDLAEVEGNEGHEGLRNRLHPPTQAPSTSTSHQTPDYGSTNQPRMSQDVCLLTHAYVFGCGLTTTEITVVFTLNFRLTSKMDFHRSMGCD